MEEHKWKKTEIEGDEMEWRERHREVETTVERGRQG